jgi:uncharacterized protein (DUF1778 family)
MDKQRIQVYAEPDTKRRIELAAAKYNVPVTEYCLEAIRLQLADDDLLEAENVTLSITPTLDEALIDRLGALQARIKARRGGQPIDIDRIMEEMRSERDDKLLSLR